VGRAGGASGLATRAGAWLRTGAWLRAGAWLRLGGVAHHCVSREAVDARSESAVTMRASCGGEDSGSGGGGGDGASRGVLGWWRRGVEWLVVEV
jgi:hypothetical protein